MATFTANVASGPYDWDDESSTNTTLHVNRTRDGGGVLTTNLQAYVYLDTSGIDSSWTITDATLRWYTDSYATTPKEDPESSYIYMWSTTWTLIESSTSDRVVGWESYVLDATERGYINDTGDTRFVFVMGDVTTANSIRQWKIRSYEHTVSNGYSVYLQITYTEPSGRKRIFIIS